MTLELDVEDDEVTTSYDGITVDWVRSNEGLDDRSCRVLLNHFLAKHGDTRWVRSRARAALLLHRIRKFL